MSTLYDVLRDTLSGLSCDVAVIGSEGPKDLDVFVLNRNDESSDVWNATEGFLDTVAKLRSAIGYEVIVRHEHRTLVPPGSRVLHLLYYPSLLHLRSWETPSFIAYVHDRGRFLLGDHEALRPSYVDYRNRVRISNSSAQVNFHLLRYAELTIGTLIYIAAGSGLFKRSVLLENLLYCLRFTVTELLMEEYAPESPIDFWDWPDLIKYLKWHFPSSADLCALLEDRVGYSERTSDEELIRLGLEILKLSSTGLSGLPSLSMSKLGRKG